MNIFPFIKKSINMDEKRPNLLFVLGEPGTGKTTQCKLIAKNYDFHYYTIKDFLINEKTSELPKGSGNLLNEKLFAIFERMMTNATHKNILLEGFVSTQNNFRNWNQLTRTKIHIVGAVYLHCPEEIMKYRIYNRDWDKYKDIEKIFNPIYNSQPEKKLLEDFDQDKKIILIETNDSIENTFIRIQKELEQYSIYSKQNKVKRNKIF